MVVMSSPWEVHLHVIASLARGQVAVGHWDQWKSNASCARGNAPVEFQFEIAVRLFRNEVFGDARLGSSLQTSALGHPGVSRRLLVCGISASRRSSGRRTGV